MSLQGIDPRLRVIAALALAAVVAALSAGPALAVALIAALALLAASRLPARAVWRRLAALEGLLVVVVLTVPFSVAGEPAFALGPLVASGEGLAMALAIVARVNAIGLGALALLGGIGALDFGSALRRLGAPDKLVQIVFLAVRYIDVVGEERRRLARALAARAFRPRSDRHTWRSLGHFIGMLLVRSFERAERVEAAMRCRGYRGRWPAAEPTALAGRDYAFAGLCAAALVLIVGLEVA